MGSLTKHLLRLSANDFRVEVLAQKNRKSLPSEQRLLSLNSHRLAFIREVILHGQQTPWVFARTVIPFSTLTGRLRSLKKLDSKPLGARLFSEPGMRRGPMQIARISPQFHILPNSLTQRGLIDSSSETSTVIWGRRSVFFIDNKPLLVNEIFLPEFSRRVADSRAIPV